MDCEGFLEDDLPFDITDKDWLKASEASLAKLQEVGTKIYNLGIADTRQLKVNKNNLLQGRPPPSNNSNLLSNGAKTAWGSNSSIPDLLRKHNERQRQQKATRPGSAKVTTHTQPTTTRRRPQSAKELTTAQQQATKEKKPPTGLGVKGMHRDLEQRPPGGIGVGMGSGWAAPPGGVLGMSGREIDDLLSEVSKSQISTGAPRPPRGSPDFTEMLNDRSGHGQGFKSMIEDLLFDQNQLPSEVLNRPPPEPIHITMPLATLNAVEPADEGDAEDEHVTCSGTTNTNSQQASSSTSSPAKRPSYTALKQKSMRLDINMNTDFNDDAPWQSLDETDDEEILVSENSARRSPLRMRTVTFNEEKNETTLITPRGAKSQRGADKDDNIPEQNNSEKTESIASKPSRDSLGDELSRQQQSVDQHRHHLHQKSELPKPKNYQGRADLKWVKSKVDTGVALNSQDEGGNRVAVVRKGSSGKGGRSGASQHSENTNDDDRVNNSIPTVSVEYFDDYVPEAEQIPKPVSSSVKPGTKKSKRTHLNDDVETMVSRVTPETDHKCEDLALVGNKSNSKSDGGTEVQWATPGSLKTKVVSSTQKNYYELALQARMAKNRALPAEEESKKTKTIKTLEFGDGEVIEHKTVSTVDTIVQQKKKGYVVPAEARPQSATSTKSQQSSQTNTKSEVKSDLDKLASYDNKKEEDKTSGQAWSQFLQVPKDGLEVEQSHKESSKSSLRPESAQQRPGSSQQRPGSSQQRPGSSQQRPGSSRRPGKSSQQKGNNEENETKDATTSVKDSLYDEFSNVRLKKQRAVSAPVRRGPTIEQGRLTGSGSRLGVLASSPYAAPVKQRPYSASVVSDMTKRRPTSAQPFRITTKLSNKEIQRVKSAAKLVKKGTLGHPKVYNTEKHYANYSKPAPPAPFVPVIRKKKMAEAAAAASAIEEEKEKKSSIVQMWTRQDDFEVETEGIVECKKMQDKLLEQGVPVTLDTLTRALLPPGECALRGATYVTSTNPTLPEDTSRLLSKPAIWFPEEFARLQRARKLAQRAEQSVREQEWDERNRMFMTSSMSTSTTGKKTKKKKKKKKKKPAEEDLLSRSSSGLL